MLDQYDVHGMVVKKPVDQQIIKWSLMESVYIEKKKENTSNVFYR